MMSSLKHITLYILPFCRVCSGSNTEWSANYLPFRSTWDRSGFLVKLLFVIVTNYIFWPLCCLLFFDIRIMINPLVSSNFFDIISYLLWCPLRFLRFNLNFIFSVHSDLLGRGSCFIYIICNYSTGRNVHRVY
jgi:hypothetical protein